MCGRQVRGERETLQYGLLTWHSSASTELPQHTEFELKCLSSPLTSTNADKSSLWLGRTDQEKSRRENAVFLTLLICASGQVFCVCTNLYEIVCRQDCHLLQELACCKDAQTNAAETDGKGPTASSPIQSLRRSLLLSSGHYITFLNFALGNFYAYPFPSLYRGFTETRSFF